LLVYWNNDLYGIMMDESERWRWRNEMATRPKGYGMSAEIARKIRSKYDEGMEQEARRWIEDLLGEEIVPGADPNTPLGMETFQKVLKNGVLLCRVMNVLRPEKQIKVNDTKIPFKMMENIGKFLDACVEYGLANTDTFATADLFESGNMTQVVNGIFALGRMARKKGFEGPTIGPKESSSNPRNFSDETLKAGQQIIGLQMGSATGANQKGMNFGKSRSITD